MSTKVGRAFITHHSSLVTVLVLTAVASLALAQSWNRWLDPIIDVGRDLYIPGELLEGKKLYRDVLYFYPPLVPYLLAAANAVIGRSLLGYALIGIVVSAVVVWQLWKIGGAIGDWTVAAAAAFLFLSFSFTGASTWGCNFIFPYAHAATIGIAFVMLFVASLIAGRFVVASVFALLAAFTKIEFAFLVVVTLGTAFVLWPAARRTILATAAAGATAFALVWLFFSDAPAGQQWLRDQVLSPALFSGTKVFYQEVSGVAAGTENLLALGLSVSIVILLVSALRFFDQKGPLAAILFVLIAAAALTFAEDQPLFRSWALFQFILLPMAWRERDRPLLLLLIVSILTSWRVLVRLSPDWYGFFLAVPAFVAIPFVLLVWLPRRGFYSRRAALLWLPIFALLGAHSLYEQNLMYSLKRFPVATQRGIFYDANADRAATLNAALEHLARSGAESLVVIPEGLTLNYFTGIRNPTPFHTFTFAELNPAAEHRTIVAMRKAAPDRVVLLTRDMSEFGSVGFGADYGRELLAYLLAAYTPEQHWRSPRFELTVLRRR